MNRRIVSLQLGRKRVPLDTLIFTLVVSVPPLSWGAWFVFGLGVTYGPVGAVFLGAVLLTVLIFIVGLLSKGYELVVPYLVERIVHPQRFAPLSVRSSGLALSIGLVCFCIVLITGVIDLPVAGNQHEGKWFVLSLRTVAAGSSLVVSAGLSYLLFMGLFGAFRGAYRLLLGGVREVEVYRRTAAADELSNELRQLLSEEGVGAALGGSSPTNWSVDVWKYRVCSLGFPMAGLGGVAFLVSLPLCSSWQPGGPLYGVYPPVLAWSA